MDLTKYPDLDDCLLNHSPGEQLARADLARLRAERDSALATVAILRETISRDRAFDAVTDTAKKTMLEAGNLATWIHLQATVARLRAALEQVAREPMTSRPWSVDLALYALRERVAIARRALEEA